MGAEIDRLEVQVEASAKEANSQLDKLVNKLDKLQNVISSIGNVTNLNGLNSGIKGINANLSTLAYSSNKLSKSTKSLTASFTKMYVGLNALKKGFVALKDSISKSVDYIEVLNYFDAAFGQVAGNAVSQWEDAGYSSAEAYYESFSSRAKELTSKMTGFNINDDGTLTATGNASLGINPTKLMNYQATFAQMSSSIGVASETSLKLSQALTEIGADLASVKNMDFDKVWTDMASGLVGMSRTLDKYGVNIRNVNLQQKLFDLGIEENITNLNQNDKALLRAIILLDSTKYAWGDLADTLEQPANQLRLLESNFSNLSRTLGNLFLPVVSKLLPYVNGLVIGLQRLFAWVGNLLGIDLSGITSAVGDSAVDIGDLLDEADGASDALGSAAKNAEKLKNFTMGIDELNINSPQDDSSSGSGSIGGISSGLLDEAFEKSFAEYQKVWDEAFANMENRANQFADKVEKFLQPVRDIIEDFTIGDFFKAGQDTSNLVEGIFNFLSDAIDGVDWNEIGNIIGDFIGGLDFISIIKSAFTLKINIWEAIAEVWFGSFEAAPIETAIITGISLLNWTKIGKELSNQMGKAVKKKIASISTAIGTSLMALAPKISLYVTELFSMLSPGMVGELGIWLENQLEDTFLDTKTWTGLPKTINDFVNNMIDDVCLSIGEESIKIWDKLFNFDTASYQFNKSGEWFEKISEDFNGKNWIGIGEDIAFGIGNGILGVLAGLVEPVSDLLCWTAEEIGLSDSLNNWGGAIEKWYKENVSPWFTKEKWMSLGENIKGGISYKWAEFTLWWKNTGFYKWWKDVGEYFDKKAWTWDGIKEGLSASWNAAIDSIKNIWNTFANWLNDKLTWEIAPVVISGKQIFDGATISLGKIPTFSIGGFPEDGLFMANHNELVGQFSNGRTAVANNEQIIEGISYGVKAAVEEALAPYLQQIAQNTRETADKDMSVNIGDREIARANNRGQKAMGLRIRTT